MKYNAVDFRRMVYTTLVSRINRPLRARSPAEYTVTCDIEPDDRPDTATLVREWEDVRRMTKDDFVEVALPFNIFKLTVVNDELFDRMGNVLNAIYSAAEQTGWLLSNTIDIDLNEHAAAYEWNRELCD